MLYFSLALAAQNKNSVTAQIMPHSAIRRDYRGLSDVVRDHPGKPQVLRYEQRVYVMSRSRVFVTFPIETLRRGGEMLHQDADQASFADCFSGLKNSERWKHIHCDMISISNVSLNSTQFPMAWGGVVPSNQSLVTS